MLKRIVKLLSALNSNKHPGELSVAMASGFLLGLMPKNNLFWYIVMIFILFLRINKPFYALFMLFGSLIAPLCDPLFDQIGFAVLNINSLSQFYGNLLDVPFVAFTKFNNTIVMGSFVSGLVLFFPIYFASRGLIALWRKYVAAKFIRSKLYKTISKLTFVEKLKKLAED